MGKLISFIFVIISLIGIVSAINISTTSYGVEATHLGLSGNENISTTNFSARNTLTYEQAGTHEVESSSYKANSGWFTVWSQGNATLEEVWFSNESTYNFSTLFNDSLVTHGMNLTYIVANCSFTNASVENVTFELFNVEDNEFYINAGHDWSIGDLYILNSSYLIRDSGNWSLNVTCVPSFGGVTHEDYSSWEFAWGTIVINWVTPLVDRSVQFHNFFNVIANVTCSGGECGEINVTLDPEVVEPGLCENVTIETCDEECLFIEEESCEDVEVETFEDICEEVCNGEGNETVCEEVCESVSVIEIVEECETENVTVCEDVNCTSEVIENCVVEEIVVPEINETVIENETIVPETNESIIENETVVENETVAPDVDETIEEEEVVIPEVNETVIELIEVVLDSEVGEVVFVLNENVSVVNSEIMETADNNELIGVLSIGDVTEEFNYITPILAIELESESGAVVSLPKNLESDLEAVIKCDEWDFGGSVCLGDWYVYATVDELEQDLTSVTFEVDSFSAYAGGNITAGDTAFLVLWDENDIGMPGAVANTSVVKSANDNVTFFADYKIAKNATKIGDGNCTILINGSTENMTYDGSLYYNYTMNMTADGSYEYAVNCTHVSYDNLSANDTVIVGLYSNQTKGAVSTVVGATPFYTTDLNPQNCTLYDGETCDVSWQVNSTGIVDKVYDFFIEAIGTFVEYTNSSHLNFDITTDDVTEPVFISTTATPDIVINDSSVTISANVEDNTQVDGVWANVTLPDNSSEFISVGSLPYTFTNIGQVGTYSVVYYANDSAGNNATATRTFVSAEAANLTMEISFDVGTGNATSDIDVVIYSHGTTYVINSSDDVNGSLTFIVPNVAVDVFFNVTFDNMSRSVMLNDFNITESENKKINFSEPTISGYLTAFALDTSLVFDNATLMVSYVGTGYTDEPNIQFWKCGDFDMASETCGGSFVQITSGLSKDSTNHLFNCDTDSFSAFVAYQYVAPVVDDGGSSGGGGGGGGGGGAETVIENETEVNETGKPEKLFDIQMDLEYYMISNASRLEAVITFFSFGTSPTAVNLTYVILDEAGNEVHRETGNIFVTTEEVLRKKFDYLDLPFGKYTFVFSTLYDTDVYDEYIREFTISEEKISFVNLIAWIVGGVVMLIVGGVVVWRLKKSKRKGVGQRIVSKKKRFWRKR